MHLCPNEMKSPNADILSHVLCKTYFPKDYTFACYLNLLNTHCVKALHVPRRKQRYTYLLSVSNLVKFHVFYAV